ncbi:hypothetical protein [Roseinatronobacter sp.]|uniref:hypothetical protein n=1 Tax=Roseinatronobacter sp. TaxID=1945755 RepID=UPI0025E98FC2|nr:hypothetical protein [Roseibaca sp.]
MSYKLNQAPVAGESFVRCPQVVIDNRLGATPTVTFHRERIVGLEGADPIRQPMSPRPLPFDPAAAVPVLNPETGEPTGATITQGELYALVYSVFVAAETVTIDEDPII